MLAEREPARGSAVELPYHGGFPWLGNAGLGDRTLAPKRAHSVPAPGWRPVRRKTLTTTQKMVRETNGRVDRRAETAKQFELTGSPTE